LSQALGGFAGLHVNKQGINPFEETGVYSLNPNLYGVKVRPDQPTNLNRLVNLTQGLVNGTRIQLDGFTINNFENGQNLLTYSGGPNSFLGIGSTNIRTSTNPIGLSNLTPFQATNIFNNLDIFGGNTLAWTQNQLSSINNFNVNINAPTTYDGFLFNSTFSTIDTQIRDFRLPLISPIKNLPDNNIKKYSTITSVSPSYIPEGSDIKTYEGKNGSRVEITSPGQRGNKISYTIGKRDQSGNLIGPVDKINAQPLYKSSFVKSDKVISKNDLVKFRIAALDKENPSQKIFIHFRAFIDSFSDNYNASWNEERYMGRGESFYKYNSFNRAINMGFTVAAQSKPELIEQYKKLNFLASNLAPTYSNKGYMGGPLVQLTMGGWCYELPGFITALTLDIPQESPWEIGINDEGNSDNTVKELPHMVKVTGFSFTPIHKFRPEKQVFKPNSKTPFGNQRYIQLTNGRTENYNNTYLSSDSSRGISYGDSIFE
jgi:hypothetical protein